MLCQSCKTENPESNKFCGKCGAEIVSRPDPIPVPGESDAYFCARHTKAITRLRCGRCETPICPKCLINSPAGTRCRACSKNSVTIRPRAVLHEAGRLIDRTSTGSGQRVWYLALWYLILSLLRNPWE